MTQPQPPPRGLFWRALVAFLALPGTIAYLVPWLFFRPNGATVRPIGFVPVGLGTGLLLWCVRDFYVAGSGTLAPWSPPKRLVTVGLYRYTRNPMYMAVLTILVGWSLAFGERSLWIYSIAVAIAFHLRVVWHEEPFLARVHGAEWAGYKARVPRWLLF